MADVNARFKVVADTSDASRSMERFGGELEKVEKAAERTANAANAAGAMPAAGSGARGAGASDARSQIQTLAEVEIRKRWMENLGFRDRREYRDAAKEIDTERQKARIAAEELGRVAGRALAKFVIGFATNQMTATAFSLMRSPGKDNNRLDQAEQTVQGAIQWGTAGAQIAGPMGAVVGSLMGGLNSFIQKEKEIRDAIDRANNDYGMERKTAKWEVGRRMENSAYERVLRGMTPDEQIDALRQREAELAGGGERGVGFYAQFRAARSLSNADSEAFDKMLEDQERMDDAIDAEMKNRKTDLMGRELSVGGNAQGTRNYYEILHQRAMEKFGTESNEAKMMKSRLDAVNAQVDPIKERVQGIEMEKLDRFSALASRRAVTDSASAKGLGVGGQIGSMGNEKVVDVLQEILRALRSRPDNAGGIIEHYLSGAWRDLGIARTA